MAQRKYEKAAAVGTTIACILLFVIIQCLGVEVSAYGLSVCSPISLRFLYPFFHANILHLLLNMWVFLSIVFAYKPSWKVLITAYIIAIITPPLFLSPSPTIGFSVIVYSLFGYYTPFVRRKSYYIAWIMIYIALGFCLPNINATIHLYGYTAGLLIGLLNKPLVCAKR